MSNVTELERRLESRGWPGEKTARELPAFLSVPETAKVLRCSPGLIYQLIREDGFPALRLGAKKYAIPAKAIEMIVDVVTASGGLVTVAEWKNAWTQQFAPTAPAPAMSYRAPLKAVA